MRWLTANTWKLGSFSTTRYWVPSTYSGYRGQWSRAVSGFTESDISVSPANSLFDFSYDETTGIFSFHVLPDIGTGTLTVNIPRGAVLLPEM